MARRAAGAGGEAATGPRPWRRGAPGHGGHGALLLLGGGRCASSWLPPLHPWPSAQGLGRVRVPPPGLSLPRSDPSPPHGARDGDGYVRRGSRAQCATDGEARRGVELGGGGSSGIELRCCAVVEDDSAGRRDLPRGEQKQRRAGQLLAEARWALRGA
jgi:hypothetical protein